MDKPHTAYFKRPDVKSGLFARCRECIYAYRRDRRRGVPEVRVRERVAKTLKRYGLTQRDVSTIEAEQGGKCPICSRLLAEVARTHIDHCHDTGRVRGILCSECNTGIGKLRDDPELLRRAVAYLERT